MSGTVSKSKRGKKSHGHGLEENIVSPTQRDLQIQCIPEYPSDYFQQ